MTEIYYNGPETHRLIHRQLTIDDAEAVFRFNGDPTVMELTGEPVWTSLEQTKERLVAYDAFERHGFGRWGCVYKPEGRVIGFSGFKYLPELDEVDLGYRLLSAYWGLGLATESGLACIQFGFETIGLSHIIALVLPENVRSIRVVEKFGMRDTGLIQIDERLAHRFVLEQEAWRASR